MNKNKQEISKHKASLNQKLFIERENLCPLCNHQLIIRIKGHLENFIVAEEAYCDHCEMVTRNKDHRIN